MFFRHSFVALLLLVVLPSCKFLSGIQEKEEMSCGFVRLVLAHEYEDAVKLLDEETVAALGGPQSVEINLSEIEGILRKRLGQLQDCHTAFAEKRVVFQTDASGNRTQQLVDNFVLELEGTDSLAWMAFTFADNGRLTSAVVTRDALPVPGFRQTWPWYGLLGLGVVLVLLMGYTIYRIVRSQWQKKWLWILVVLLGNVTQVGYSVLEGWFFNGNLLSFNILPLGFTYMGSYYSMKAWIAFPLGMLIVWGKWLLDNRNKEETPDEQGQE